MLSALDKEGLGVVDFSGEQLIFLNFLYSVSTTPSKAISKL